MCRGWFYILTEHSVLLDLRLLLSLETPIWCVGNKWAIWRMGLHNVERVPSLRCGQVHGALVAFEGGLQSRLEGLLLILETWGEGQLLGVLSDPLPPRPINNYKQIVPFTLCWLMLKLLLKVLISSCYRLSAGVGKIVAPTEMGECNQA